MSEFRVPYTKILKVERHPNADRLAVYTVFDFQVIGGLNQYKVGDMVIYVPIDSILSEELENILFDSNSKIKLNKRRVKQIRIRKIASQGMLINVDDVAQLLGMDRLRRLGSYEENECVAVDLNITKYEPPASKFSGMNVERKAKRKENKSFGKYGGIENIKWSPTFFEGQDVVITEKIHGSNFRAALLPYEANSLWKKLKKLFGAAPTYEFCYGSNNVQLQERNYTGFYDENIYAECVQKYDIMNRIKENETIYGEIYGSGIQKGYTYGCKEGERKFVVFDVKIGDRWLTFDEVKAYAKERGFDTVPELYRGQFSMETAKLLTIGDSVLAPEQKVREGVVVKPVDNQGQKRVLKLLSETYLDNDQTDFH